MMSNAHDSDATQKRSPILPSTSGRMPFGSRKATTRSFVMTTVEKAPCRRGMTSADGLLDRVTGMRREQPRR